MGNCHCALWVGFCPSDLKMLLGSRAQHMLKIVYMAQTMYIICVGNVVDIELPSQAAM